MRLVEVHSGRKVPKSTFPRLPWDPSQLRRFGIVLAHEPGCRVVQSGSRSTGRCALRVTLGCQRWSSVPAELNSPGRTVGDRTIRTRSLAGPRRLVAGDSRPSRGRPSPMIVRVGRMWSL